MAGPIQPTFIQGATTNITGLITSLSPSLSNVMAGDTLVLDLASTSITSGYIATSVTDPGATWFRGPTENSTVGTVEIWYGVNASVGGHTVTVATNSGSVGAQLDEFSGIANVIPIIDVSGGNTATATTIQMSLHPTEINELLYFGTVSASTNAQTAHPTAPFVPLIGPTAVGASVAGVAYVPGNALVSAYIPKWTQTSGAFAVAGLALQGATPIGDLIWNDTSATTDIGVFESQATPDYDDSVISGLAEQGTGILSGCAVSPNTGADFDFQVASGTALLNWGQITVASVAAQAIQAASSVSARRDLVYVTQGGVVSYTAGAPSAIPCPPPIPVNCIPLAFIDIPANATTLDNGTGAGNAHVTDKRVLLNYAPSLSQLYVAPSAALFETVPRAATSNQAAVLGSGTMSVMQIGLPAGLTVGHITFVVGNTGASTPTHWWFCLLNANRNLLAVTADQLTTVMAATTAYTLAIATTAQGSQSTFTTTYAGRYYLGILVVATTPPTMEGASGNNATGALSPQLTGTSTGSLTAPPAFPFTGNAIGGNSFGGFYAYVGT